MKKILNVITLTILGFLFHHGLITAQQLNPIFMEGKIAGTDILLCSIRDSVVSDSQATIMITNKPVNITNRPGYDDQPMFMLDGGAIMYSSIRNVGRSDIYLYDIATGRTRQLTNTPDDDEFSPAPEVGGGRVSVVRIGKQGVPYLYQISLNKYNRSRVIDSTFGRFSYYAWLDNETMGAYAMESARYSALHIFYVTMKRDTIIATGIGRCVQHVPKMPAVSYSKNYYDSSWIWVYDFNDNKNFRLVRAVKGSEFHAWGPHRLLLMGSGTKLYSCRPPVDTVWTQFADLAKYGYSNVSRIAVSSKGDYMAVVVGDGTATEKVKGKMEKVQKRRKK